MTERTGDVVYTPDWVVKDMIDHFRPAGRILDPCRGKGAFTDHLPGADWCEITDGRDFFDWIEPVDWVIGNPPYSLTRPWFKHSYSIAANLLYLVPLRNVFSGYGFLREIAEYGGPKAIRVYGTGGRLGFPMGNAVGALHVQRDYRGTCEVTFYADALASRSAPVPSGEDREALDALAEIKAMAEHSLDEMEFDGSAWLDARKVLAIIRSATPGTSDKENDHG